MTPSRRKALAVFGGGWLVLVPTVLFLIVTIVRSRATPFWHDELYTVLISSLPSTGDVWRAFRDGVDLSAPLNLFLTHGSQSLGGVGYVASRLPAMCGFIAMSAIVFSIVRSRSTVLLGLSAALLPWFTRAYRYSYEARGYGVMLGLFAILLWSWSQAARGRLRRPSLVIFAVACAATIWNHYLAVVTFVPIAAGEIVRWIRAKRLDPGILTAGVLGVCGSWPLLWSLRQISKNGGAYWRHASWSDIGDTYWFLFRDVLTASPWILAIAGAAIAVSLVKRRFRLSSLPIPAHEVAAGVAAVTIPALSVGMGYVGGGFTPRYALTGIVGFVILVPLVLWWLANKSRFVELFLFAILAGGIAQSTAALIADRPAFRDPVKTRPLFLQELHGSLPVVVTGGIQFLQLWYYTPPELRNHVWYVADPELALKYLGSNTIDLGYAKLVHWSPVNVKSARDLMAQQEFVLYDDGSGWLPQSLSGATVTHQGSELGDTISHVTKDRPDGQIVLR